MSKHLYRWICELDGDRAVVVDWPRGAHRVDDRQVISGIMHMLKTGARGRDCPAEYGPNTTICNRFDRWRRQGVGKTCSTR